MKWDVDQATDERIQQTIREEMFDATILCIAQYVSSPSPSFLADPFRV